MKILHHFLKNLNRTLFILFVSDFFMIRLRLCILGLANYRGAAVSFTGMSICSSRMKFILSPSMGVAQHLHCIPAMLCSPCKSVRRHIKIRQRSCSPSY